VATNAVVHDHLGAGINGLQRVCFAPDGENGGVAQPIFGLEVILVEDVILRHVTIVTGGVLPVRAVHPRGVIGGHEVAVHARFRLVGKITVGARMRKKSR